MTLPSSLLDTGPLVLPKLCQASQPTGFCGFSCLHLPSYQQSIDMTDTCYQAHVCVIYGDSNLGSQACVAGVLLTELLFPVWVLKQGPSVYGVLARAGALQLSTCHG